MLGLEFELAASVGNRRRSLPLIIIAAELSVRGTIDQQLKFNLLATAVPPWSVMRHDRPSAVEAARPVK